jgi:hypothetical protein
MNPKELYFQLSSKSKDVLNNYILKGDIFKKVSIDINEHLVGVCKGVLGEVNEDDSVTVYQLSYNKDKMSVKRFLQWKNGEIKELTHGGRGIGVSYVIPDERDQGVYLTRTNQTLIALRA